MKTIFENPNWKVKVADEEERMLILEPAGRTAFSAHYSAVMKNKDIPQYLRKHIHDYFEPPPKAVVYVNGIEVFSHGNVNFAKKEARDRVEKMVKGTVTVEYQGKVAFLKEVDRS